MKKRTVLLVFAILLYIALPKLAFAQKADEIIFPLMNSPELLAQGKTPTGQAFAFGFYFGENSHQIDENNYKLYIGWEKGLVNGYEFPSDSLGSCTVSIKEGDSILVKSRKLFIPFDVRVNGALPPVIIDVKKIKFLTIEVLFKNTDYISKTITVSTHQFVIDINKRKLEQITLPEAGDQFAKIK